MCRLCVLANEAASRLTRRSFHKGVLAATIADPLAARCLSAPAEDLTDPAIRLVVPPDAPRTVALTLDACSGEVDHRILDTLIALSVPATIFISGLWLRWNHKTVAMMLQRSDLFSLQNHGERHLPPVLGDRPVYGLRVAETLATVHREVERGASELVALGVPRPGWYRGAAALYSPATLRPIEQMGFRIGGYSLSGDEGASLPAPVVERRIAGARSGDVIIAHINQPHRSSGAGVAAGVRALKAAGTRFVTLDALPVVAAGCRIHHLRGHAVV